MIRFRYKGVEFYDEHDAHEKKLVQLTKWLFPTEDEVVYLQSEYIRIQKDPTRICMLISNGCEVALFVNPIA